MKIEKCPFCDKDVAEISNCQELVGCRHFEKCPATEPYVCVVCNMHEGGCGASSGYYDSAEKAIAAWNRRAGDDINVATNADRIRSMNDIEKAVTIEDAIAWFEWELADGKCNDHCPQCNANEMALDTLREVQKREKGCEFCKDVPSRYRGIRAEGFYQVAADEVYNPELQVSFCPVCGKRLEVNHEVD
jgi:hypothetical protein